MRKVRNTTIPREIAEQEIKHKYPTRFSKYNSKQPPAFINQAKFSMFFVDHRNGKEFYQRQKKHSNLLVFNAQIK